MFTNTTPRCGGRSDVAAELAQGSTDEHPLPTCSKSADPIGRRVAGRSPGPTAGALDPTFNADGIAEFGVPAGAEEIATSTAIDSAGRILVAGYTPSTGTGAYPPVDYLVARYTLAGDLDSSFGIGGVAPVDFGPSPLIEAHRGVAIAVDSMDRVLLVGTMGNWPTHDFAVARLTSSGLRFDF